MADTTQDGDVAATMEDLFGEEDAALDVREEEEEPTTAGAVPAVTVADLFGTDVDLEARAPAPAHTAHKEDKAKRPAVPAAVLNLPSLSRLSSADQVSLVRMPRIVGISSTAYDPETFDEAAEAQYLKSVDKSGATETLVRFRFKRDSTGVVVTDAEGRPVRESNARIVEWQDGGLTLHVGKEVFSLRRAVKEEKVVQGSSAPSTENQNVFVFARLTSIPREEGSGGVASSSSSSSSGGVGVAPPPRRETVLEAQAAVASRFTVGGLAGSAVVEQSVLEARASRSRALKRQRVAQIAVSEDLEMEKGRRIRAEDEASRQLVASKRKAEVARSKEGRRGGRHELDELGLGGGGGGGDEGDEEGGGGGAGEFDLGALKKRAKKGAVRRAGGADGGYDSMSQDEEDDG